MNMLPDYTMWSSSPSSIEEDLESIIVCMSPDEIEKSIESCSIHLSSDEMIKAALDSTIISLSPSSPSSSSSPPLPPPPPPLLPLNKIHQLELNYFDFVCWLHEVKRKVKYDLDVNNFVKDELIRLTHFKNFAFY